MLKFVEGTNYVTKHAVIRHLSASKASVYFPVSHYHRTSRERKYCKYLSAGSRSSYCTRSDRLQYDAASSSTSLPASSTASHRLGSSETGAGGDEGTPQHGVHQCYQVPSTPMRTAQCHFSEFFRVFRTRFSRQHFD